MQAELMTVEQKVGQLLMIGYPTLDIPEEMEAWIKQKQIGNVILFSRNIGTPEETYQRVQKLQSWAYESLHPYPLLIGTDQENGVVSRLQKGATRFPGAMALGATGNLDQAKRIYQATGEELRAAGISVNFAPTVDVNNNADNPVIGVRSFGEAPEQVARFGEAAIQGLLASGVIPSIKHFPGHGDTSIDSHEAVPVLGHDRTRLDQVELVPFQRSIAAGVPMVMVGHISLPSMDESGSPATYSKEIVTGILRESLGFDGVAITDCMEMAAIAGTIGVPEAAVRCVQAGIDLVLVSHTHEVQQKTYERLVAAIHSGELSDAWVNEAVNRVLQLKKRFLSWEHCLRATGPSFDRVQHADMARSALAQAITLVKNEHQLLPLQRSTQPLGVIFPGISNLTLAEDGQAASGDLVAPLRKYREVEYHMMSTLNPTEDEGEMVANVMSSMEQIVVFTYNAHIFKGQSLLVNRLVQQGKKVVAVALRNPYDLLVMPEVDAYLAVYDHTYHAIELVADILFGERKAAGHLPVSLFPSEKKQHGVG
ncbi:glycoside hydrolase family 3 protein [Brevibacillus sp. BC25]|uniref:glycoside hydrolase family 3 protein n=1 Tax=Brevibacillus sp. BC25 TaxID=1144308 RepID=UPI0002713F1B|nr:glycoside hydrolase family 3 protein [Brevibacillus sp. BC25]EJL31926.1 beta-glucosidase-like glycosyl hydrolase [Brevibacillus sp. BC25]